MNVGNTFSATSISKFFKSENRKTSPETIEREFGILEKIQNNFPKYVISMDKFDMSRNGIKHFNIIDFLTSFIP